MENQLTYAFDDIPPWYITVLYSIQLLMTMIAGPMATVYLLYGLLCPEGDMLVYAQMLSTALFMCGLCTLMQTTFGIRLPVFQGSSVTILPAIAAASTTQNWPQTTDHIGDPVNASSNFTSILEPAWMIRIQLVSGSLAAASAIQVLIGITGIMGFLMTYIGPLTIAPCVTLIAMSLIEIAIQSVRCQWGIAVLTMCLMLFFCLFMGKLKIPLPTVMPDKGCTTTKYPIFRLFPHLFAMLLAWLLCYILTITDVFSPDSMSLSYRARTDVKLDAMDRANWFFFPYPGRWGWPKFHPGLFAGIIGTTVSSIIESIGDYYATAAACQLPPPPKHAVNRGIAMEGLGSILSGLVGASHSTTTYSEVIGYIGLTGVASRFVFLIASIVTILAGLFGKFGAFLTLVPDPILGGMATVAFGMVAMVGLSNLRHIDLKSSRNHMVLGLSLMLGMMVPMFMKGNPGAINTGNSFFDQVLTIFLSTAMFVGGVVGFILDNLVPGTAKERGLLSFNKDALHSNLPDEVTSRTDPYNLPFIGRCLNQHILFSYIPCLPQYVSRSSDRCHCRQMPTTADDEEDKL